MESGKLLTCIYTKLSLQRDQCCEANLPQVSMINLPVYSEVTSSWHMCGCGLVYSIMDGNRQG